MKNINKGSITPALLVIVTAFILVIYGLLFVLSTQFEFSNRQIAVEKSFHIAEAGINYYRWHLSIDGSDYQDGTGEPGPYIHDYHDPQGDRVGQFSLDIIPPPSGSDVVTIRSTGWTDQYPNINRTIEAEFGRVSLTRYAFLHNSNLWFGNDVTVNGPVFSNGGIRQDGTNTSTVESPKETYICGDDSGCFGASHCRAPCTWSGANNTCTCPGIWGQGGNDELWDYPVAPIDFNSIRVNFPNMRQAAQDSGVYLGPSGAQGYRLIFQSDGTVDVFQVTGVNTIRAYSVENGCENLPERIVSQSALTSYSLDDVDIMFIEDNTWIEGTINGEFTLAVARFPLGVYKPKIWIRDDLIYLEKNGDHRLGIVAESDIVLPSDIPDRIEINGALLAQTGRIIFHHYGVTGCRTPGVDRNKHTFRLYGSLISEGRAYWNFNSGPHWPAAGFVNSILDYDPAIYSNPPPYFPSSGQITFLSWREIRSD